MKRYIKIMAALMLAFLTLTQTTGVIAQTPPKTTQHLKKDGTADKRYKENKTPKVPLKKDGTPDMRYKANKTAAKKK